MMHSSDIFTQLTVKDVVEFSSRKLIVMDDKTTVAEALLIFKENAILSAPVKDAKNKFIGIIDTLDLITYATTKFVQVSPLAPDSYQQMDEFANKEIKDLIAISGRNAPICITLKASLHDLASTLSQHDVHRVVVINEAKDLVGIVSQLGLIEYLSQFKETFSEKLNKRAENFAKMLVVTIPYTEFVISAFKTIWNKEITGVAVINEQGELVGNVSASDLRNIRVKPIGEMIHDLYQPIKDFLHIRSGMKDEIMMATLPRQEPISVTFGATLGEVMDLFVTNHIHRVYVVTDHKIPVGVISLSDLIQPMIHNPPTLYGKLISGSL